MEPKASVLDHTFKRRLADLYRLAGFQTLSSVTAHPNRPNALVVHLRRLKKIRDLLLLQQNDPETT
jgi:hypothetical protein